MVNREGSKAPAGSPATSPHAGPRDERTRRQAGYGLSLFAVYLTLYVGFVLLNAFAPEDMGRELFAGLNIAVGYGMGLIIVAFVLALFYAWLCRRSASSPDQGVRG